MLELLVGLDAVRRLTTEAVAVEPARRRRPPARRSRAAAAYAFVSAAVVALASPAPRTRAPSRAGRHVSGAQAD
jgi:hypothetical protein